MIRLFAVVVVASVLTSCKQTMDDAATMSGENTLCTADVGLTAWARDTTPAGVTVYGTTNAPDGVTVRAIAVAAEMVTRTSFNFRTWSIELSAQMADALTRHGQARIPIVAYASSGCQVLSSTASPVITIDGGADDAIDSAHDASPDSELDTAAD